VCDLERVNPLKSVIGVWR